MWISEEIFEMQFHEHQFLRVHCMQRKTGHQNKNEFNQCVLIYNLRK